MQNTLFEPAVCGGLLRFDLKPFGIKAMDSLRLEKSYRLIPREDVGASTRSSNPASTAFARLDKGNFLAAMASWPGKRPDSEIDS